jgi:parallel beta-helix repeat protein
VAFIGAGKGRVTGNRCSGGRYQIVLTGTAAPVLSDNRCDVLDQR